MRQRVEENNRLFVRLAEILLLTRIKIRGDNVHSKTRINYIRLPIRECKITNKIQDSR